MNEGSIDWSQTQIVRQILIPVIFQINLFEMRRELLIPTEAAAVMTLLGATKWQFLRCIKVYMAPFENLAAQQEWNLSNCKPGWSERSSSYIFFAGLTRYYTSKLLTVTHIELVNISSIYFHGIWNYSIIKSQILKWNYFLGHWDERALFTVTWICRSCSMYF